MDVIPFYEPAYPEESPLSHMLRLAILNGLDIKRFIIAYVNAGIQKTDALNDSCISRSTMRYLYMFQKASGIGTTSLDYLFQHTNYPFFTIFSNADDNIRLINNMFRPSNAFKSRMGLDGQPTKYCPECMREKAYYRRVHQIPSVHVCPVHGVPLRIYKGKISGELDPDRLSEECRLSGTIEGELKYAKFVQDILKEHPDIIKEDVKNAIDFGIATKYGSMDEFINAFRESELFLCFTDNKYADINKLRITLWANSNLPSQRITAILAFLYNDAHELSEAVRKLPITHLPKEDFMDFARKEGYELISEYRQDAIVVRHKECGFAFVTTPRGLMNGWLCPRCDRHMSEFDFVKQLVKYSGEGEYELLKIDSDTKRKEITIRHIQCGRVYTTRMNRFIYGYSRCTCSHARNLSNIRSKIEAASDGKIRVLSFDSETNMVKVKCSACGAVTTRLCNAAYMRHPSCSECIAKTKQEPFKDIEPWEGTKDKTKKTVAEIKALVGNEFTFICYGKKKSGDKKYWCLKHNSCGKEIWCDPKKFRKGYHCKCEGYLLGQCTPTEIKRFVKEASIGRYECIEANDVRNIKIRDTLKNTISIFPLPFIVQEFLRPTPSIAIPCEPRNRNTIRPQATSQIIYEYLKKTNNRGIIFFNDTDFSQLKVTEKTLHNALYSLVAQGKLEHPAAGIYYLAGVGVTDKSLADLLYIGEPGEIKGCLCGESFLCQFGLVPEPDHFREYYSAAVRVQRTYNHEIAHQHLKSKIGDITVKIHRPPCEITKDNYKIMQVLYTLKGYANTAKRYGLKESDFKVFKQYLEGVSREEIDKCLAYYSSTVANRLERILE